MNTCRKTIIDKRYLAEGLSFLGFQYKQEGFGKGSKYIFDDTTEFRYALHKLLELRKELNTLKDKTR